jgi:hypothetical protein
MDSPQLIGSEPPPLWGFRILRGNSMFELGKTKRRVEVLERDTIPQLMGEMGKISLNLERISSQVSKLIVLVAVSGVVGSPEVVQGILGGFDRSPGSPKKASQRVWV